MARPWSLLVGIFSTFMYTCLFLYNFVMLLYVGGFIETEKNDHDDLLVENRHYGSFYSTSNAAMIVCDLIAFMAMIIFSVLLQIGIKQERDHLISPWLYGSILVIVMKLVGLILFHADSQTHHLIDLLTIVLQLFMGYPIHVTYKEIRQQESIRIENCIEQTNGAVYYIGRASTSVYSPTTTCLSTRSQLELDA